jgi:Tol biopolymer transport system component
LTTPSVGVQGDVSPAFSPDGKLLAFAREAGPSVQDLYLVPVAGGEPKRLTFDSRRIEGLAWTADGREIIFASRRQTGNIPQLWRIPATGGEPERVATFAQKLIHPAISSQGNRLAYAQNFWDTNIWRVEVPSSAGRRSVPTKFIYSTLEDELAEYSPDGRRIAFVSKRSGNWEVWVCKSEGEDPIPITNFGGPVVGHLHWSPDGRRLVFSVRQASSAEGNMDIYLINTEGGNLRRLTTGSDLSWGVSWSRDGRWISFVSNRSGSQQIWKMPAEGGQALQVTKRGITGFCQSPDGKFFYYRNSLGLWRIPVEGGEESLLLDERQTRAWRTYPFAVVDQGIYFVRAEAPARPALAYFSFATGKVNEIAALEKSSPLPWSLSVSPNGRWILYTQMDQGGSDIMLMENFR